MSGRPDPPPTLGRFGYVLEVEDTFAGPALDERLWLPHYLPHWSSRVESRARYEVGAGRLVLRIDADQPAWSPRYTGELRVSSLQTGVFAGPRGSAVGQHRFRADARVQEEQAPRALYTPTYGLVELRARFPDDPTAMAAFWMIGYEDAPERAGEICIAEIFGRDIGVERTGIGMGIHPFGDPALGDEFGLEQVPIDAREAHWYAAEWTPDGVGFYVDERLVKVVAQAPAYPMQVMVDVFEFREPGHPAGRYPKEFVVEAFRGWRLNSSTRLADRTWDVRTAARLMAPMCS